MKAQRTKKNQAKIFIICGPSGSGKTTLLAKLIRDDAFKGTLIKSVSLTTRPKRHAERQGKDYFFVSEEDFKKRLKGKKILEWTRYLGYHYGTPREFVDKYLRRGVNIGVCLDIKGARALKRIYPRQAVTIFVLPPSIETLKDRINGRCRRTDQTELNKRLMLARREMAECGRFDYCILNKELTQAIQRLKAIISGELN